MNLSTVTEQTMSSREISEIVESRHDSVKRTIETLSSKRLISFSHSVEPQPRGGKPVTVLHVCKRDSYVVVAQLSPEFTARLVDRWQELEQKNRMPALPDFNNPVEAARAWADEAEAKQKALTVIEQQQPKVEFVDRFVTASGLKGFRQVVKLLKPFGATQDSFRKFLEENRIMYKLGGDWTAYQNHIDAGRFETKAGINKKNNHAFNQCMFTPKGVEYIAGKWIAAQQMEIDG